jgi:hypothetical protein
MGRNHATQVARRPLGRAALVQRCALVPGVVRKSPSSTRIGNPEQGAKMAAAK